MVIILSWSCLTIGFTEEALLPSIEPEKSCSSTVAGNKIMMETMAGNFAIKVGQNLAMSKIMKERKMDIP